MLRDEMIRLVLYVLRCNKDARQFGGLRFAAEEIVDEYLRGRAA